MTDEDRIRELERWRDQLLGAWFAFLWIAKALAIAVIVATLLRVWWPKGGA